MNRDPSTDDDKRSDTERPTAVRGPNAKTPGSDMQAEDAGTAASGNAGHDGDPQKAMKQEHKTGAESNGRTR